MPEPGVPAVPDHFINEAWMDKTVKPGDDFYMYALGTWFNSHTEGDKGFMGYYDAISLGDRHLRAF